MYKFLTQRLHVDPILLIGILLLCGLGLIILYSASGQDTDAVTRQVIRIGLALGVMLFVAQFTPAQMSRWALWFYAVSIVLLVLVLLFGQVGKGAQRWLALGPISFQPSELLKVAVPMLLAAYLSGARLPPTLWRTFIAVCAILIPVALIARQPDLGTAVLVAAGGFAVLFMSGMSWTLIFLISGTGAASLPVLWYFMRDYQRDRVIMFLDPERDPLGAGYHIIQSSIAIGSGGLYGKGWLNGTQSHLEFLPERSTDFIFAVFSEEFGLMGVMILVSLYLFVIARGLQIAIKAQDTFGKLLAGGLVAVFFVYIFVNMGMVSGQLPVVGIPLPLISMGGTAMVTIMAAFGILMAIHTNRRLLSD
jgi:rod shape determining protein RodA